MVDEKKDDKKVVKEEEKAVFLKSTAALDLERREEDARLTDLERRERDASEGRDFTGDGNDTSDYVGVSPEYMNYANEGDKPYRAGKDSAVGRLEAELTAGAAVAEPVETKSNQTDGGGSSVPLVYATFSGENFENRVITADEAKAEAERVAPKDSETLEPVEKKNETAPPVNRATPAPAKTSK